MEFIKPLHIGENRVNIKHLQFAYDTLLFVPLEEEVIWNYLRILDVFNLMSGLTLNYEKSSVLCWNSLNLASISSFCESIGCNLQKLPVTCLGLPLGANPRRRNTWEPVISMMENRLSGWKRNMISRAGKSSTH